jgi:hypothetical protein
MTIIILTNIAIFFVVIGMLLKDERSKDLYQLVG